VLRRRFDYLARDSLHLSIKLGCDFSRILNFSKARKSRLCLSLTLPPPCPFAVPSSQGASGYSEPHWLRPSRRWYIADKLMRGAVA